MHTFSKLASILALSGLLAACQDEATPIDPKTNASPMYTKGLTLAAPSDTDLIDSNIASPTLPPY